MATIATPAATNAMMAAPTNADEKPSFMADVASTPDVISDDVFDPATATIAARPIAEPTWYVVLTKPDARPPSSGRAVAVDVIIAGM